MREKKKIRSENERRVYEIGDKTPGDL
jgi:hypothetical protein